MYEKRRKNEKKKQGRRGVIKKDREEEEEDASGIFRPPLTGMLIITIFYEVLLAIKEMNIDQKENVAL